MIAALLAAWALPRAAEAALILYEGFGVPAPYSAGAAIQGTNPSVVNFSGGWSATNDDFGRYTTQSIGLTAPGGLLPVTPGRLAYSRINNASGNFPKFAARTIANNATTQAGYTELWASGLIHVNQVKSAFFSVQLSPVSGTPDGNFVGRLTFGLEGNQAFLARDHNNFSNSQTAEPTFTGKTLSTATFSTAQTHLLLVRLANNALGGTQDVMQLWVNPDLSLGEAGLGAPTVELATGNMIFDDGSRLANNQFRASIVNNVLSSPQAASLDEFRLGTDFLSVAVPEPSTLALAALALAAAMPLAWRRLRRRAVTR